jgi:hypothetical protein
MPEWFENHQLPCFYHQVLGLECPICGFQTAFILLLKGEFLKSISVYPALIPSLLLMVLLGSWLIFRKPGPMIIKWLAWSDLALILGSWLVRIIV